LKDADNVNTTKRAQHGIDLHLERILASADYWHNTKTEKARLKGFFEKMVSESKGKNKPLSWLAHSASKRLLENMEDFKPSRLELDKIEEREQQ